MAEQEVLFVEQRGPVEWVTLNRPDSGNALSADLVEALVEYFEALRDREAIRIVVLKANGKHFCAGLDLADEAFASQERTAHNVWSIQRRIARVYLAMRKCPQPVISLIQGAAC